MNRKSNRNKKQVSLSQSLLRKKTTKCETIASTTGCSTNFLNSDDSQSSNDTQGPSRALSTSLPEVNDFDDSFDLFLPRKALPKVPVQPSFFDVKKKSRYFDETGELKVPKVVKDDDLELALAVSLEESKGNPICLKPTRTTTIPQPRGRLKHAYSQSLLMRRTPEDRERIVTEKVAIVLMNTHKLSPAPILDALPDYRHSLYSSLLRKQVDELKSLWTLSQEDLLKVKSDKFNTSIIVGYIFPSLGDGIVPSSESGTSEDEKDADQGNDGGLKLTVSSEDIFDCSDGEDVFSQGPSPKRLRNSTSTDNLNKTPNSGDSSGNRSCDEKLFLRVEPTDLIESEAEEKPDEDGELGLPAVQDDRAMSRSDNQGCQMEWDEHEEDNKLRSPAKKNLKQLSQLSSDLKKLSSLSTSKVIRISRGSKVLYAHTGVFKARCPLLCQELENDDKCLDKYSWPVCIALFDFIYTADLSESLKLSSAEKEQMIECCRRFSVKSLLEEIGGDDLVEVSPHMTTRASSPLCEREEKNVPDRRVVAEPVSNTAEAASLSDLPVDAVQPEVVVLDSDCCTLDDTSSEPVDAGTDEELDSYLKDGIRMLEKDTVSSSSNQQGIDDHLRSDVSSPSKLETKTAKKSIGKYFEDSFPSFSDIKIAATPPSTTGTAHSEGEAGTSKAIIKNCVTPGGKLIVSEVATPLPDYESMVSPELQDALHNYGIKRGIGRRKAVTLLKYIYDQIHPPVDHPAVVKALNDVASSGVRPSEPASSESEVDIYSLSSDASDLETFEELGDVTSADMASPIPPHTSLLQEIIRFVKSDTNLYVSILRYEPIWLNQIHKALKEDGVKCNKKELIAALDELGITFRTEQTEKQMQRRRTRNVNTRRRR